MDESRPLSEKNEEQKEDRSERGRRMPNRRFYGEMAGVREDLRTDEDVGDDGDDFQRMVMPDKCEFENNDDDAVSFHSATSGQSVDQLMEEDDPATRQDAVVPISFDVSTEPNENSAIEREDEEDAFARTEASTFLEDEEDVDVDVDVDTEAVVIVDGGIIDDEEEEDDDDDDDELMMSDVDVVLSGADERLPSSLNVRQPKSSDVIPHKLMENIDESRPGPTTANSDLIVGSVVDGINFLDLTEVNLPNETDEEDDDLGTSDNDKTAPNEALSSVVEEEVREEEAFSSSLPYIDDVLLPDDCEFATDGLLTTDPTTAPTKLDEVNRSEEDDTIDVFSSNEDDHVSNATLSTTTTSMLTIKTNHRSNSKKEENKKKDEEDDGGDEGEEYDELSKLESNDVVFSVTGDHRNIPPSESFENDLRTLVVVDSHDTPPQSPKSMHFPDNGGYAAARLYGEDGNGSTAIPNHMATELDRVMMRMIMINPDADAIIEREDIDGRPLIAEPELDDELMLPYISHDGPLSLTLQHYQRNSSSSSLPPLPHPAVAPSPSRHHPLRMDSYNNEDDDSRTEGSFNESMIEDDKASLATAVNLTGDTTIDSDEIHSLPDANNVEDTGIILGRTSLRTIVLRKWQRNVWMKYGDTTMLLFKCEEDVNEWLSNASLTKRQRDQLIKVRFDFLQELSKQLVRGFKITSIKLKSYERNGNKLYNFKLEKWTELDKSIAGAFASETKEEIEKFRLMLQRCLNKCPHNGLKSIDDLLVGDRAHRRYPTN